MVARLVGPDAEARERVREQQLIAYVQQFLKSPDLRRCHPSIRLKSTSQAYIPKVRPPMYQGIRKILELQSEDVEAEPFFFQLRCDERRLRLYVIVPGPMQGLLKSYAEHLREEMRSVDNKEESFYPREYHAEANEDLIQETSSVELPLLTNNLIKTRQPDGALSIKACKYPFLVLELVASDSEKDVIQAANDYIYGSNGMIRFVIILSVTNARNEPGGSITPGGGVLKPTDVVHARVFESVSVPRIKNSTGAEMGGTVSKVDARPSYRVSKRALIEKVIVYPSDSRQQSPTHEFFELSWSDIVDDPPHPCPPSFVVSLEDLHEFLRDAVTPLASP